MKHVRFAKSNTIYPLHHVPHKALSTISSRSLPDELIQVATSSSSLPTKRVSRSSSLRSHSDRLQTSHTLYHHVMAHAQPLPMRLHFLLAFSPYKSPSIRYDLSLPFSIIDQSPNKILSEPATEPPISALTITSPMFQWEINVTPSPSVTQSRRSYVSVLDVLLALYRELSLSVHPKEYKLLPSHEATMQVNEAYFARCGNIADPASRRAEEMQGVKRIDFLMGKTRFLGLSTRMSRRNGGQVWELNVD